MSTELITAACLASILEQVARRIHSQGYAEDLFPAQWAALRYIDGAAPQMRTAIDLARFQGMASGAVARTVRTLVTKGHLRKIGTIGRGRAEQLELTEAGRDLLAKDPLRRITAVLEELDGADRQCIADGLRKVVKATLATSEPDSDGKPR